MVVTDQPKTKDVIDALLKKHSLDHEIKTYRNTKLINIFIIHFLLPKPFLLKSNEEI